MDLYRFLFRFVTKSEKTIRILIKVLQNHRGGVWFWSIWVRIPSQNTFFSRFVTSQIVRQLFEKADNKPSNKVPEASPEYPEIVYKPPSLWYIEKTIEQKKHFFTKKHFLTKKTFWVSNLSFKLIKRTHICWKVKILTQKYQKYISVAFISVLKNNI